jgi:hypothetical protein
MAEVNDIVRSKTWCVEEYQRLRSRWLSSPKFLSWTPYLSEDHITIEYRSPGKLAPDFVRCFSRYDIDKYLRENGL